MFLFPLFNIDQKRVVYFWALCSVPLISMSVLMLVPSCFDYYGVRILIKIGAANVESSMEFLQKIKNGTAL